MLIFRHWTLACVLLVQSLNSFAKVGVEFPEGYSTAPYENHYKFDLFEFHPKGRFGVAEAVNFPDRSPFIVLKRFFESLASSDPSACQAYFSEHNPDIESGIMALRKMLPLDLVADWKQDGHWVVILSKGGNRGKSMVPFVMKDDEGQKFVTDARFLGDFIGLLGKFLVDHPDGELSVSQKTPPTAASSSPPKDGVFHLSATTYLIFCSALALLTLVVLYAFKFRK